MTQPPVLVLLPGMDGTGELFAGFLAALRGRMDTVVVRYPQEPLDYAALSSFARAALPVGRPFVLVAESFSGPVGISLAAEHPPGLRGLVLCSTFARNPRPSLAVLARWLHAIVLSAPLMRIGLTTMLGGKADPMLRAQIHRIVRNIPHAVLRARLRAVLRVDVSRQLAAVDTPIHYLQASRDAAVPGSAANFIRKIKPDTQIVRMDGPHFLLQVNPSAAADEIVRFATPVSPGR